MLRGAALLAVALVLMPGSAFADLPPPEGFEFVPYGFQIDGLARFPDHVVVAFPWRAPSGGELSPDHTTLEDGKAVRIGRRSPIPELYAVKKAAFEDFEKMYKPVPAGEAGSSTEGFLRKWVKCDAAPTLTDLKKLDDPRSEIIERFRAERIDDKTCHLVAVDAPNAATSASGGRAEPRRDNEAGVEPKDAGGRATADPGDHGIAASRGSGCSGCAMGGGAARPALGALALLAGLMAARRRRGRTPRRGPRRLQEAPSLFPLSGRAPTRGRRSRDGSKRRIATDHDRWIVLAVLSSSVIPAALRTSIRLTVCCGPTTLRRPPAGGPHRAPRGSPGRAGP